MLWILTLEGNIHLHSWVQDFLKEECGHRDWCCRSGFTPLLPAPLLPPGTGTPCLEKQVGTLSPQISTPSSLDTPWLFPPCVVAPLPSLFLLYVTFLMYASGPRKGRPTCYHHCPGCFWPIRAGGCTGSQVNCLHCKRACFCITGTILI